LVTPLPYAPPPNSDELLSGWIERIGIFFGIDYLRARAALDSSPIAIAWGENEDLDSSDIIRRLLVSWTGYGEHLIPPVLPTTDDQVLDVSARLTYCSKCWYEDAENGRAPYVRRQWAFWSSVLCTKHETWLCARRPGRQFGSERNGWAPVWQTDPTWASASHLRYDPALRPLEAGFDADTILGPTGGWQRINAEFQALVHGKASILNLVMRPECVDVRAHVWAAIEVARSPRITDYDLRGYRRPEPGWIMDRICCLAIAAEVRRIIVDCEPAFERVRHVLGTQPAARKLLHECRAHMHPTHSSCHLPDRTESAVRTSER
jgi:hypothetical protein